MTAAVPSIEPEAIVAGDTLAWSRSLADYPAGTWTLTYRARLLGGTAEITIVAGASGTAHLVGVAAATSAGYTPGTYEWAAAVSSGSERHEIGRGLWVVKADPAALPAGFDGRSHARQVLEAIEAVIAGRATKDQAAYTINGRQLTRTPIPDLLLLRDRYKAEVAREEQADRLNRGLAPRNRLQVRF